MSIWLTAKECLSLPGMPGMEHNIRNKLEKSAGGNADLRRRREGTKAFEYHIDCLPDAAREAVQARMARQLCVTESDAALPAVAEAGVVVVRGPADSLSLLDMYRKCPALMEKTLRELTENQKMIADARMTLVRGVIKLMDIGGMSRKGAVDLIATGTRCGTLSPEMLRAASVANARKGSTRNGVGTSSLQRWLSDYLIAKSSGERLAIMAPGKVRAKKVEQYPWMGRFLQYWRNPNQPSVTMAYEAFADDWRDEYAGNELMLAQLPKVDVVRYALNKLPKAERERGRITGAEYKSLLPFVRRDWSALPVNGAWVGDGHGIKMEVVHPATGWPFMAEITLVVDSCTRFVVGWSLALSENQVAVGDAIRHAVSKHGVPLIYYSDNGGGEKNKIFDADITGIFSRLEIEHQTGIAGNPQARGIIERLNKEIPLRVAKAFGSYVGKSGDRETRRVYRKKVRSAFNAFSKGKELTAEQKKYMAKVPRWEDLLKEIEVQVQRHNTRPHNSLPLRENGEHWTPQAYRNHLIKQENIVLDMLTTAELHEMFRPEVERIARRGEINLFNNRYFSEQLTMVEGEKVRVCFDIHDPNSVIVRRMDGSWVCDAIWDGNKVAAFPMPYVEMLQEKRTKRRRERLLGQLREVEAEVNPALIHKPDVVIPLVKGAGPVIDIDDDEDDGEVFTSAAARLRAMGEK